jgi:predicted ATPase/DNA-binding CsgD family transcriptional regulator
VIGRGPLIGRDRELGQLAELLAAAAAGEGRLVLLAGEAGAGKTRLAEAAIADGTLTPVRGAAAVRGATPYGPLVAVLRDALRRGMRGFTSGPLSVHLGTILPELEPPAEPCDRATLFEALAQAFALIAEERPTVVFLDDLQWGDAATFELLPSLAAAAEQWPLLFLGAYRSDELPRDHPLRRLRIELRRAGRLCELEVAPLDTAGTAVLAEHILDGQVGPRLRAAIYDRTQGIPFFIEELAAGLAASQRLVRSGLRLELESGASIPIPETIRDAARFRADGLSTDARSALEAAAAIGTQVPLELLSSLGDEAALVELLERGLLNEHEPGMASFRHDLIREALYADTPWPRRRMLHRQVAQLLEAQQAEPRLVADHWLAARQPDRARPLLLEAARRFCAVHAYRDAARAAQLALEIWPENEDEAGRLATLDELGRCAQLCGELAEAARAWEELATGIEPAVDRTWWAVVSRQLATVYELQGRGDRALDAHQQAAALFADSGLNADAASEELLVARGLFSSDPLAALAHVDLALAEAGRSGRGDLQARSLSLRGFFLGLTGHRDDGMAAARAALAAADDAKDIDAIVDAYWTLGTVANFWADYGRAENAFEAAATLCRQHGRRPEEDTCVTCLGLVLFNRGDWARAEKLAREVHASGDAPEHATGHATWILGIISATRGATKRARSLLRRALKTAVELPMPVMEVQSTLGLALAEELEGTASQLWRDVLHSPPSVLSLTYASGLRWGSSFAARRGDHGLARACADGLSTWAARFASTDALAGLAHALGEVTLLEGATEQATEQFARALELLREIDAPFELAHTQMRAGVALARAGHRQAAVSQLVDAYRTFHRLQARPFSQQAAAELLALNEQVERHLGRRAARDLEHGGLTRRQIEVLRLVAVGRTNREIAGELYLSPRTIDMHVRDILAKLACRSRSEATARAHELGLLQPTPAGR